MGISIRNATHADASIICNLSTQLGYSVSVADTEQYLIDVIGKNNDLVLVAVINNTVVGWIQTTHMLWIESGWFCEIVGLVTEEQHRGKGIGRELIAYAKQWYQNLGCNRLKVRTNVIRNNTHNFYASVGFTEVKEQKVFELIV